MKLPRAVKVAVRELALAALREIHERAQKIRREREKARAR